MEITNKTAVLVDAKNEYTNQIVECMAKPMLAFFEGLFESCAGERKPLIAFQKKLQVIPEWNANQIREHSSFTLQCPWFTWLLTAVFVSHVKVLTSVRLSGGKPNIRVKVPADETFIHLAYMEVAEELYYDPHVMKDRSSAKSSMMTIIRSSIEKSVRKLLPVEEILKAYVGHAVDDHHMYTERISDDDFAPPEDDDDERSVESERSVDEPEEPEKTLHIEQQADKRGEPRLTGEPQPPAAALQSPTTLFSDAEDDDPQV